MSNAAGLIFGATLAPERASANHTSSLLDQWSSATACLWAHFDAANPETKRWLTLYGGLDELTIEALLMDETRPRIVLSTKGVLIILRGVNSNPGADPEDMVAVRMWFSENRVITMRRRRGMAVADVRQEINDGSGPESAAELLVRIVERITDRMGEIISEIDDTMDEIEETVVSDPDKAKSSRISSLRRQCIHLRRYIAPQRDVLQRLVSERIPWLDDAHRQTLREAAERTARFVEDIDACRERAMITSEELVGNLNSRMNKAMYVLSIVTAIFLPLGLLTGLLGINVGGIPGAGNPFAFAIVSLALVLIALVLIYIFRRIHWL